MKTWTLRTLGTLFFMALGGFLVWAHMSNLAEACRQQSVALQSEHRAMAEALTKAEAKTAQAYQWIAESAAAKVDLTIPFKPLPKAEQISSVQAEVGQIDAMAKFLSKAENAWKLATRGR